MVLLPRKHTVYAKIENVEGTAVALTATEAHLALSPSSSVSKEMIDRGAASASLSREKDNVATGPTALEFGIDARGSGSTSSLPVWDPLIRACAFKQVVGGTMAKLTIGAVTNGPFMPGQTVVGGTSGGSGKVVSITPNGVTELFVWQAGGETAFDTAEVVSVTSGASATTSGVGTGGAYYIPDSYTASNITTTGSWTGTGTIGEVLVGGTSGAKAVLRAGNAGTPANNLIFVEMVVGTGSFTTGETLTGQESGATIVTGGTLNEVLVWTPSLTMRSNIDGLFRQAVGARGNFRWTLAAKQPSRFDFSFMGDTSTIDDQAPPTGTTFPTTTVLQFASASVLIDGTYRVPIGAIELDMGNEVNPRTDPNATSGCRSYVITGREPVITMDPEMTLTGAYDWYTKWQNATSVTLWASLGTTAGNRLTLHCPNLQIDSIADGDRDGIWTAAITAKPRRNTDAGNDELVVFMT